MSDTYCEKCHINYSTKYSLRDHQRKKHNHIFPPKEYGLFQRENGTWQVTYCGHYLGCFRNKNDAIEARRLGEEKYARKRHGRIPGVKNKNPFLRSEAVLKKWAEHPPPLGGGPFMNGQYKVKNKHKYKGDHNQIWYRSSWELLVMRFLDANPNILEWSSEEIIIPYTDESRKGSYHRYIPDFLVKLQDKDGNIKTVILEIKPKVQTEPPSKKGKNGKRYITETLIFVRNQCKFAAATRFAEQRGWEFRVITEKELGLSGLFL